jgi:hypothetical protein
VGFKPPDHLLPHSLIVTARTTRQTGKSPFANTGAGGYAVLSMQKLVPVEEAKTLFHEAKEWGVWKWLTEKRRVRAAADAAWAALEECDKKTRAAWPDDLKLAYREAETEPAEDADARARRKHEKATEEAKDVDPKIKTSVRHFWKAEVDADKLHWVAEDTFAEADRRLSAGMAREGCHQAIDAWEAREKLIRKAESLAKKMAAAE